MNVKRGFFRLALVLSAIFIGVGIVGFYNNNQEEEYLWFGLGSGIFIWLCYWIIAGFSNDKSDSSEN